MVAPWSDAVLGPCGHASRLGRDLKNRFGTATYAAEELVAELSSAMLGADLLANIIIVQFFLTVLNTIGGAWSFGVFAILAVLAWVFVWRLAPETKGRELEEIQGYWENGGRWPASEEKGTR